MSANNKNIVIMPFIDFKALLYHLHDLIIFFLFLIILLKYQSFHLIKFNFPHIKFNLYQKYVYS